MLVFNERRASPMLKYSDLTKSFTEFVNAQDAYWERMQKSAYQLLRDLEDSLDLPSAHWRDGDGNQQRYVEIGTYQDGDFNRVHPSVFQRDDFQYTFTLKVTLEEGPEIFPKASFTQTVTLRGTDAALMVHINGEDELTTRAPKEVANGQFAEVVEIIKSRIIRQLAVKDLR